MLVSIVIPVRNQPIFVDWCLQSIINNTENIEYEVIIIDDCSNDETKKLLNKYSNRFLLYTNDTQKWLSHNWNNGAKLSTGKYICFLNSDTIVSKNWLQHLIDPFDEFTDIGISGPSTSCCWGKQQILKYHSNRFNLRNMVSQIASEVENENKEKYEFIDVVGFGFLTLSKIFKTQNIFFDETFKGPGNEADWILRIRELGYKSVWCKKAYIHHFGRMSFNGELGHEKAWALWREGDTLLNKKYGKNITLKQ